MIYRKIRIVKYLSAIWIEGILRRSESPSSFCFSQTMPALSRRQQKIREKEKKAVAEQKLKRESYVNQTPFRDAERNFKSRFPEPDFSKVIDLETVQDGNPTVVKTCLKQSLSSEHFGKCSEEAYIITSIPGKKRKVYL